MTKIRLFLAEDHAILRAGLKRLLSDALDMVVIGEARNGQLAVAGITQLLPDVVIMDISMPILSGMDATRELKLRCSSVRILGLSKHGDADRIREFMAAGGAGYLHKRAVPEELFAAVRAVHRGEPPMDSGSAATVYSAPKSVHSQPHDAKVLTGQETMVTRSIALGFSNKEIAAMMNLSVKSVETYKARAMEKAGLRSRVDIVRYAQSRDWYSTLL